MPHATHAIDEFLVAPSLTADGIYPGMAVVVVTYDDDNAIEFTRIVFATGTLFQQIALGAGNVGIAKYNIYGFVAAAQNGERHLLSTLGIPPGSWSHRSPVVRRPYQAFTVAETDEAIRLLRLEFELLYGATGEERFMTAISRLETLYPRWLS